jgi:glyoxylase-like metal-dependent hydrolase (beta-lactamase superfamily II)
MPDSHVCPTALAVAETRIGHFSQIVMETTMTATETTDAGLSWDVLTIRRPGLTRDPPAGKKELMWVANSSTLIHGERDAVLVDTFLTIEQSQTLLSWVVASGKNLTAIYVTHGHGDHFFGLAPLLERFPRARAVATPEVVKAMHEQLSPASVDNFWRRLFPGQIPDRLPVAEPLEDPVLELEGHKLIAVNAGRTDTAHSTCLHVPSIGLIAAGDAVYNGIHPYLGETDRQSRLEWISTLDKFEALNPLAVIAGHKIPENDDDPRIIGETRQYIRDDDDSAPALRRDARTLSRSCQSGLALGCRKHREEADLGLTTSRTPQKWRAGATV